MKSIKEKLVDELERQGLPRDLSQDIARDVSPAVEQSLNSLLKGDGMECAIMGGVSIASVQQRIHALFPAVSANDQGSYSRASAVIRTNPSWSEDQVVQEVAKSFQTKAQGGYTVTAQESASAKEVRTMQRAGIIVGGAVLVIAFLAFRQSKHN